MRRRTTGLDGLSADQIENFSDDLIKHRLIFLHWSERFIPITGPTTCSSMKLRRLKLGDELCIAFALQALEPYFGVQNSIRTSSPVTKLRGHRELRLLQFSDIPLRMGHNWLRGTALPTPVIFLYLYMLFKAYSSAFTYSPSNRLIITL